jgi:glyoxylase-like metal-dependent hydrolase (beta-lactamase superfamily II)
MNVKFFEFNPFSENTYVVYDDTYEAAIIDPGCFEHEEYEELVDFVKSKDLKIKYILNTHCHVDHVLGNFFCKKVWNVPLLIPLYEVENYKAVKIYAPNYGFFEYKEQEPDGFLKENQKIYIGNSIFDVIYVPGHSAGHVLFYEKDSKQAFVGDTIMRETIGRWDLPGGDQKTLMQSLKKIISTLPKETRLFPGHGPFTTLEYEQKYNPYLQNL